MISLIARLFHCLQLEFAMPNESRSPDDKRKTPATEEKKVTPVPTDDTPQREDEYLSKFLQESNPESGKDKAPEKKKQG
ncbi:MAG TPA: hypothetical protein VL001_00530 [Candidimonas sp.]|nr:hypothetical protein [Candidimonas sp.]